MSHAGQRPGRIVPLLVGMAGGAAIVGLLAACAQPSATSATPAAVTPATSTNRPSRAPVPVVSSSPATGSSSGAGTIDIETTGIATSAQDGVNLEPATGVTASVTAAEAVAAAQDGPRGEARTDQTVPKAELAFMSYGQQIASAEPGESAGVITHRLVWVVDVDSVPVGYSVPRAGMSGSIGTATVRWYIDASTGKYVMTTDFVP